MKMETVAPLISQYLLPYPSFYTLSLALFCKSAVTMTTAATPA